MMLLIFRVSVLVVCAVPTLFSADVPSANDKGSSWSPQAAASYLDGRLAWWADWPQSARDHGTFCVSCHTVAPYAVSRRTLRSALGEQGPSPIERRVLENVTTRVRMWNEIGPYYPDKGQDPKTTESRGTESILNALVLVSYDAAQEDLSPDTRAALDHMWALQLKSGDANGAWAWLQFHNQPWEGDSQFYGAAMAAVATGSAPASYQDRPEVRAGLQSLREYLLKNRDSQTLMDRVVLLWAAAKLPKLLSAQDVHAQETLDEVFRKQQADGGFSMTDFAAGWKRRDGTPLEAKSDGYATGVVAFVLQERGMTSENPNLQRALTWLVKNQEKSDGRWLAYSMNKQRDLSSDVGRFMADAATAYAVLALDHSQR